MPQKSASTCFNDSSTPFAGMNLRDEQSYEFPAVKRENGAMISSLFPDNVQDSASSCRRSSTERDTSHKNGNCETKSQVKRMNRQPSIDKHASFRTDVSPCEVKFDVNQNDAFSNSLNLSQILPGSSLL